MILLLMLMLAQSADSFVNRMMAFDKNNDGKLTRAEITDDRLLSMFDRADANKDGIVTKEELTALYAKEQVPEGPGRGRGRGPGGPGGPPPQSGEILPPFMRDQLNLTSDQRTQLDALQKEVTAQLEKILTQDQLRRMRERRGPPPPPR
jgi:EF hand